MTASVSDLDAKGPSTDDLTARESAPTRSLYVVRVLVLTCSVLVAAGICLLMWAQRPAHLNVSTDIVGYPTLSGFDPRPREFGYYLIVAVFPVLTLCCYAILLRAVHRLRPAASAAPILAPTPTGDPDVPPITWKAWSVSAIRVGLVGLALGWEAAITRHWQDVAPRTVIIGFAYGAVVGAAAYLLPTRHGTRAALATINACATPLVVFGIYLISRNTSVTVVEDGSVHHFPWFPMWLAVALSVLVLLVVVRGLRRSDGRQVWRVERRVLLFVVGPILVFLAFASIQGAAGVMDVFESGQWLVGARYLSDGALPYRDFVAIHGPLMDGLMAMVGPAVIQDSFWGVLVGLSLFVVPLYWVLIYVLNAFLYRRNAAFLASTVLIVLAGSALWNGLLAATNLRMVFAPAILLALGWLLAAPTRPRAYVLVGTTLLLVFLTPELAFVVVGCILVLLLFEYHYREPGARLLSSFRRVVLCAEASLVLGASAVVVLGFTGVLEPMIEYFVTFSRGHNLTGSWPIPSEDVTVHTARLLLPLLLIGCFAFMVARIRGRRPLELADWVMSADAIFVLLYYPKFFGRPDAGHFFEVWTMAVPLVFYIAFRLIDAAERLLARAPWGELFGRWAPKHLVTLVVALAVLIPAGSALTGQFTDAPGRFDKTVPAKPRLRVLGYSTSPPDALLADLKSVVSAVTSGKSQVFDFTNAPGLFYYELGYESPTRYYHVSTAIRADTQADLIAELRRANPAMVAYEGGPGLNSWDGIPNSVRHYDVSSYILRHYRPLVDVDGMLLFVRDDIEVRDGQLAALHLQGSAVFDDLYGRTQACPWGLVADFSDRRPAAGAPSRTLKWSTSRGPDGRYRDQVERPRDATGYRWLEITTDRGFARDDFVLSANGDPARAITFSTDERSPNHYLVRVDACGQWWGFDGTTFVVDHEHAQHIRSYRLIG